MLLRRFTGLPLAFLLLVLPSSAQDVRSRKYKAPPPTSHVEILVLKNFNKKPIPNAAVVFHPVMDGRDEGNLEVKTDPDGKAIIDVIPTGSTVTVQVIADGFATWADEFVLKDQSHNIVVNMIRPRAQISTYEDNRGKPADMAPGVQEPPKPSAPPPAARPAPPAPSPSAPVAPNPPSA
jgi:hypothetical protein